MEDDEHLSLMLLLAPAHDSYPCLSTLASTLTLTLSSRKGTVLPALLLPSIKINAAVHLLLHNPHHHDHSPALAPAPAPAPPLLL